jgi:hypothetical protein
MSVELLNKEIILLFEKIEINVTVFRRGINDLFWAMSNFFRYWLIRFWRGLYVLLSDVILGLIIL